MSSAIIKEAIGVMVHSGNSLSLEKLLSKFSYHKKFGSNFFTMPQVRL